MSIVTVFTIIGGFFSLFLIIDILIKCYIGYRVFISKKYVNFKEKFGSWAVVTGCTDGIGKAYSMELAKRGINIILISRNIDKLKNTAAEIESKYGVETKIIVADFSKGEAILNDIKKELEQYSIGILVNNVGAQYSYPMYLTEIPEKEVWDIININVGVTTMMTKMILPQMKDKGKGAIVNISSSSEFQPWPLFTVYSASKVYIKYFSDAIRAEYEKSGITVQHLTPAFVGTKMNNFSRRVSNRSLLVPDAEEYARSAVSTLGVTDSSTGFWAHGLQYFFANLAPFKIRIRIAQIMNQIFRKDYLTQQELLKTSKIN